MFVHFTFLSEIFDIYYSKARCRLHGLLSPTSDAAPRSMQHPLLINEKSRLKPFINIFEPLVDKTISLSFSLLDAIVVLGTLFVLDVKKLIMFISKITLC